MLGTTCDNKSHDLPVDTDMPGCRITESSNQTDGILMGTRINFNSGLDNLHEKIPLSGKRINCSNLTKGIHSNPKLFD
jgi:hypothetical protein